MSASGGSLFGHLSQDQRNAWGDSIFSERPPTGNAYRPHQMTQGSYSTTHQADDQQIGSTTQRGFYHRSRETTEEKTDGIAAATFDFLKVFFSVFIVETALCALFMYDISSLTGAIAGASSSVIDATLNMTFNYFSLESKLIKLACKVILTTGVALFFAHKYIIPGVAIGPLSFTLVFAKLFWKNVYFLPVVQKFILKLELTPPEKLLTGNWGTANLLNDDGKFDFRNFMWPATNELQFFKPNS